MRPSLVNLPSLEIMVHNSLNSIILESVIPVPKNEGDMVQDWFVRMCNRFQVLNNSSLNEVIESKTPGWQLAKLIQLKNLNMIKNLSFDFDETRKKLLIAVQPVVENRFLEMNVAIGDEPIPKGN